jgi:hypothetical protein
MKFERFLKELYKRGVIIDIGLLIAKNIKNNFQTWRKDTLELITKRFGDFIESAINEINKKKNIVDIKTSSSTNYVMSVFKESTADASRNLDDNESFNTIVFQEALADSAFNKLMDMPVETAIQKLNDFNAVDFLDKKLMYFEESDEQTDSDAVALPIVMDRNIIKDERSLDIIQQEETVYLPVNFDQAYSLLPDLIDYQTENITKSVDKTYVVEDFPIYGSKLFIFVLKNNIDKDNLNDQSKLSTLEDLINRYHKLIRYDGDLYIHESMIISKPTYQRTYSNRESNNYGLMTDGINISKTYAEGQSITEINRNISETRIELNTKERTDVINKTRIELLKIIRNLINEEKIFILYIDSSYNKFVAREGDIKDEVVYDYIFKSMDQFRDVILDNEIDDIDALKLFDNSSSRYINGSYLNEQGYSKLIKNKIFLKYVLNTNDTKTLIDICDDCNSRIENVTYIYDNNIDDIQCDKIVDIGAGLILAKTADLIDDSSHAKETRRDIERLKRSILYKYFSDNDVTPIIPFEDKDKWCIPLIFRETNIYKERDIPPILIKYVNSISEEILNIIDFSSLNIKDTPYKGIIFTNDGLYGEYIKKNNNNNDEEKDKADDKYDLVVQGSKLSGEDDILIKTTLRSDKIIKFKELFKGKTKKIKNIKDYDRLLDVRQDLFTTQPSKTFELGIGKISLYVNFPLAKNHDKRKLMCVNKAFRKYLYAYTYPEQLEEDLKLINQTVFLIDKMCLTNLFIDKEQTRRRQQKNVDKIGYRFAEYAEATLTESSLFSLAQFINSGSNLIETDKSRAIVINAEELIKVWSEFEKVINDDTGEYKGFDNDKQIIFDIIDDIITKKEVLQYNKPNEKHKLFEDLLDPTNIFYYVEKYPLLIIVTMCYIIKEYLSVRPTRIVDSTSYATTDKARTNIFKRSFKKANNNNNIEYLIHGTNPNFRRTSITLEKELNIINREEDIFRYNISLKLGDYLTKEEAREVLYLYGIINNYKGIDPNIGKITRHQSFALKFIRV